MPRKLKEVTVPTTPAITATTERHEAERSLMTNVINTLTRIDDRLDRIDQQSQETSATVGVLKDRSEQTGEMMDQLVHTLLTGNGSPALTVQIATNAQRIQSIEEYVRNQTVPKQVWVGIIFSILVGIASIIITLRS